MEEYIVIAKRVAGRKDKFEDYRIQKYIEPPLTSPPVSPLVEQPMPAGFEKVFGPASLDRCVRNIQENCENQTNWQALTYFQYVFIGGVTLSFIVIIIMGTLKLYGLGSDKDTAFGLAKNADESARVLITFLVAVSTIAFAFLAIVTAMVVREYKERFALAKEVLTVLVGILGTIIGFYFGTANNPAAEQTGKPTPTATASQSNNATSTPTPTP
jgi:hypothetical protein